MQSLPLSVCLGTIDVSSRARICAGTAIKENRRPRVKMCGMIWVDGLEIDLQIIVEFDRGESVESHSMYVNIKNSGSFWRIDIAISCLIALYKPIAGQCRMFLFFLFFFGPNMSFKRYNLQRNALRQQITLK